VFSSFLKKEKKQKPKNGETAFLFFLNWGPAGQTDPGESGVARE
jgi:hypothetical protein